MRNRSFFVLLALWLTLVITIFAQAAMTTDNACGATEDTVSIQARVTIRGPEPEQSYPGYDEQATLSETVPAQVTITEAPATKPAAPAC